MAKIIHDVPYAAQSQAQKLDIYLPEQGQKPYPVIVWLHPGGFHAGDKTMMVNSILSPLAARGYALVGVNYRLTDEATFPAQIFDAKAAIRWVRSNAAKYSLNPEKIAAWGCSAGATLAALLGTSAHVKSLADPAMGNADVSSRVSAVVDWYGPIDLLQIDKQHLQLGQKPAHNDASSATSKFIGGPLLKFPEKCKAANPITHITKDAAPFFIQHGRADDVVPYLQSVMLSEALQAAIGKDKVELVLVENAGHFDSIHQSPENISKALDFLDKHMK